MVREVCFGSWMEKGPNLIEENGANSSHLAFPTRQPTV